MKLVDSSVPVAQESERLVLRVVSETAEFSSLKSEWNALVDECPDVDFFSSWVWTFSWWMSSERGRDLRIYVVRNDRGDLKAILPCCLTEKRALGLFSYYQLGFIGSIGEKGVYYQDLIARPRDRAKATNIIIPQLLSESAVWDMLSFANMPTESPLTRRLPQEMPGHRFIGKRRPTAMLELPPSWNLYLDILDREEQERLEQARQQFGFMGDVHYRIEKADQHGVLLKKFHESLPATHKTPEQLLAKQTQLFDEQDEEFQLAFHYLENDSGDWVAAMACIFWRSTCYCIEFRERPNSKIPDVFLLLVGKSIEHAIGLNFSRCDLLGGNRLDAKLALTHQARDTVTIGAYRDTRLGRMLRFLQRSSTALRRSGRSSGV
ncbi:MAG: GNAT family N-acetyltransferase [Lysobacterales bacterium]